MNTGGRLMTDQNVAVAEQTELAPAEAAPDPYAASEAARRAAIVKRPNGSLLIIIGVLCLLIGVSMTFFGAMASDVTDPGYSGLGLVPPRAPTYNQWKWPVTWIGSGLISVGVLLWSIIRAVFFLPGRDVTQRELEGVSG
jgi:hypothetical protein